MNTRSVEHGISTSTSRDALRQALGYAGRDTTGPQSSLTVLYPLGMDLPWDWPRKKKDPLAGLPKIREATEEEKYAAKRIYEKAAAA